MSEATVCRAVGRLCRSRKRSRGAAERDAFLRSLWHMEAGRVNPGRLVFVDEMGTHTSLAPLYAYAPIGERAFFEIPRNRGNTTLLSSLHAEGMGSSMAVEGATTARVFETYVEHFLSPVLKPGQLVVMNNLGAYRPKRVRELIEAKGCKLPEILHLCTRLKGARVMCLYKRHETSTNNPRPPISLRVDLTPDGGQTRVWDVNADEGGPQSAGSHTKLPA